MDLLYGSHSVYVRTLQNSSRYSHFANEKILFSELTRYSSTAVSSRCSSSLGDLSLLVSSLDVNHYISINMHSLLVPCGPDRIFSHCQPYQLFNIDMKSKQCSPYKRQSCRMRILLFMRSRGAWSHRSDAGNAVLVVFHSRWSFSFNRFDRIKYFTQRWKGPMSIACFIQQNEIASFVKSLSPYFGLPITFIVYIPQKAHRSNYFIKDNGEKKVFICTLYPMNLLRDLAIESIHTTHYMNIDADLFVSSPTVFFCSSVDTIEQSIQTNLEVLQNEHNVLLFLTFQVALNRNVRRCMSSGIGCEDMYIFVWYLT